MGMDTSIGLTDVSSWGSYYTERSARDLAKSAVNPSILEDHLQRRKGKIFELGCGGSHILARSSLLGWTVSGIDFHASSVETLKASLRMNGRGWGDLINADVLQYDESALHGEYDILVSNGFLEHFLDPSIILSKWSKILKPGGLVISIIPNLYAVNALLLKKLDAATYDQHYPFSPNTFDEVHLKAGLRVIENARYIGKYDLHMLIPWDVIRSRVGSRTVFRLLKLSAKILVAKPLSLLSDHGLRHVNSKLLGVYGI